MPVATGYAPSDKVFRHVTRALEGAQGFPPAASSLDAGWRRFALNCWRGAAEEVVIDQIPDLQVVVHTGGIAAIPFLIGGKLNAARSSPGMITVMPPGTRHRWLVQGEVHSATLHFSTQCDVPEGVPANWIEQIRLRTTFNDPLITSTTLALTQELQDPREFGSLFADTMGEGLILHLLRIGGSFEPRRQSCGLGPRKLARVIELIEASLESGISLERLAREAGLGRAHFCRSFRQATGCSPHQYLTSRRIGLGCRLLADTSMPISEIALRCGFYSQAHFGEYFRRAMQVTPLAYRRDRGESIDAGFAGSAE